MAITHHRGFTLIVALVLMSVMLSFGVALSTLAFKQHTLALSAIRSQYAFYNADTALECALYADQQAGLYDYPTLLSQNPTPPASLTSVGCLGYTVQELVYVPPPDNQPTSKLAQYVRITLGADACADVQIVKQQTGSTTVFAQGYDTSCTNVSAGTGSFVNRGILSKY